MTIAHYSYVNIIIFIEKKEAITEISLCINLCILMTFTLLQEFVDDLLLLFLN